MIAPEKTILLGIMIWCILEITRDCLLLPEKSLKVLILVPHELSDNFFEQVVRYLLWEAQISRRRLEIAAISETASGFDQSVAALLLRDGVLASHLEWNAQCDLQLVLGRPG